MKLSEEKSHGCHLELDYSHTIRGTDTSVFTASSFDQTKNRVGKYTFYPLFGISASMYMNVHLPF